jgi:hypothetical protein
MAKRAIVSILLTGLLLVALFMGVEGCQRHKVPRPVVVDEWWANDYAVEAGWSACKGEGLSDQYCNSKSTEDGYRQDEAQFTEEFSTAFQAEAACSGITLAVYKGPQHNSPQATQMMTNEEGYWSFQVNFEPEAKTQRWQMSFSPKETHASSGEGNASSIAHAVCSLVKGVGGSVKE